MKKLLFLLLFFPMASFAVDGVYEINQLCVATGCFPGDNPGFPVTLANPGSYRLTSNLDVRALSTPENRTALAITASLVSLDLNNFSILGPVSCTGTPVTSCTPSGGSGSGIILSTTINEVRISNGTIRGMGSAGIFCNEACIVRGMTLTENGGNGFGHNNRAAVIEGNVIRRNGGNGIFANGQIVNNIVQGNGGVGIFSNPSSRIVGNQVLSNGGNGIRIPSGLVLDNIISLNGGVGIDFASISGYGRNVISGNAGGAMSGTGFALDANLCDTTACP